VEGKKCIECDDKVSFGRRKTQNEGINKGYERADMDLKRRQEE
jgi:hypothetical protein